MRLLPVTLSLIVFFTQVASAQDAPALPAYRMRLIGVFDDRSGDPVEAADIVDVLSGNTIRTTSTGTAALAFLPEGGGLVRIRKVGFEPQTMMVSISPTDTLPITILLKHVVELAGVTVTDTAPRSRSPGLRGFEERRRNAASGTFITEAEIRKEENRQVGNFLIAHVPNIVIINSRSGGMTLRKSPRCGRGGDPDVYLDGVLVAAPKPIDVSEFNLQNIAAIEYYPNTATAPPEFNRTSSGCGALLLWSRQ
ncbi:MAG: hypothetical protein ABIY52_09205 [Gemmatimonadaceae bacterium]